jgi:copper chaperone CopZ
MKKTIIMTLVIGVMTMISATAQNNMDQFQVQVDGLGCPFCAYGLEKKFNELKGIKQVKIDIETGDFSFAYPADKALTMEAVLAQVEKAGYTPVTAKITRANGKVEASGGTKISVDADNLTQKSVMVAGNCGMCEARINKAASEVNGVASAAWNNSTKMLTVSFDASVTNLLEIEKAVSKSGHDTKNTKANAAKYNDLPGCCKYERL